MLIPGVPVWRVPPRPTSNDPAPHAVDDLIVGAGITGLTTALLLARAGRRVAVIDAGEIGSGTTGASSAKVSLLQGNRLSELARRHSPEVVYAYLEANREGQAWLVRFCEAHDVPFQVRRAVTFAAKPADIPALEREFATEQQAGLESAWADDLDVPFPLEAAIVLHEQAQIDPLSVTQALAEQLRKHGGTVSTGLRLTGVDLRGKRVAATTAAGTQITASHLVLATGTPVLDRGLHFAQLRAERSYVVALSHAAAPTGMFLSIGKPTLSVRDVPERGLLLVGGFGHVTGRTRSEQGRLDGLRGWAQSYFPAGVEEAAWAAQDYSAFDALPIVDVLPRSKSLVHVATGYGKWGFSNGVAAALTMSADVLGTRPEWARRLASARSRRALLDLVTLNAAVGTELIRGELGLNRRLTGGDQRPRCTHLGGKLRWNDAALTWDCPLHGSRFDLSGQVIEGPARQPISDD